MKFLKEELTSIKNNVADIQEKIFFTAGNRVSVNESIVQKSFTIGENPAGLGFMRKS